MTEAAKASATIMARLKGEAKANGSERRLGTLARLEEACDDIVSGRALDLAREHGWDKAYFMQHRRLVARSVHEYVLMRRYIAPKSVWNGPTKDTIAHDKNLSAYLSARDTEREVARRPSRRGTKSRAIDDIIAEKLDFNDQAAVRAALEGGRLAKRQFDTLAAFFHKLAGVDLRQLDAFSFEDVARSIRGQIGGDDRQVLSKLVERLQNNTVLVEMGLVFRNGRVKMDYAPGTDLVRPEELTVLVRLAGPDPDSLVSIN